MRTTEPDVILFSTPTCGHCRAAREFLESHGIMFKELDVSRDDQALRRMLWLTGRALVPTLKIRDQVLVGFDPARVEQMLGEPSP